MIKYRPLVECELSDCALIFGNRIDYASIRIHTNGGFPFQGTKAVTWGNRIFFPKLKPYRPGESLAARAWFVHELVHIYQHQSGEWYRLKATIEHLTRRNPYAFELVPGRPYIDYGIEQRAEIVKYYFIDLIEGKDVSRYDQYLAGVVEPRSIGTGV